MNEIQNISIGADPEVFLYEEERNKYIPSIGLVGGTKANPKPIPKDGFFVQEDNVMAEFNIPPAQSAKEFVDGVNYAMGQIEEIIPNPLKLVSVPSAEFDEHFLEDEQACMSGCDPYNNAWKNGETEEAVDYSETNSRFAGGHIHIGYTDPTEETSMKLVKCLDLFLGVPSVLLDEDEERRETYGKAGAYRTKEYGVEYRSLSNFWLGSDSLIEWTYKATHRAINFTNNGFEPPLMTERVINGSFKNKAEMLIDKYDLLMP